MRHSFKLTTLRLQSWHKLVLGILFGILVGLTMGEEAGRLEIIGVIFINIVKTAVIPMIFFTIIYGITNIERGSNMRKISAKSGALFLITALIAANIGIGVTHLLEPGKDPDHKISQALHRSIAARNREILPAALSNSSAATSPTATPPPLTHTLLEAIPNNFVLAFSQANVLQIILIAFFLGIIISGQREKFPNLITLIHETTKLFLRAIEVLMRLAPYGVFGYIASLVGTQGLDSLASLGKLVTSIFLCCLIQYALFGLMIRGLAKIKPWPFYRKTLDAQMIAFSTSSSKAALVPMLEALQRRLGVSKETSLFVLPLSAALNMDGGAIYQSSCAIFFAQALGVDLSLIDHLVLMVMCTIASIGGAGIPSGAMLFLGMVLNSVGLPMEGVLLIATVDRVIDMMTTVINVTGDACITLIIDESEGKLDKVAYNADPAAVDDPDSTTLPPPSSPASP